MCEIGGTLTITYDDGSYLKGRIGHQGYYVPCKGGDRMRKQALEHEGEIVNATTVRGMLVRIGGENGDRLPANNGGSGRNSNNQPRGSIPNPHNNNKVGFQNRGGYKWVCENCKAIIYATSEPRFCPKCK